jgi:hypothetical protein
MQKRAVREFAKIEYYRYSVNKRGPVVDGAPLVSYFEIFNPCKELNPASY